MRESLAVVIPCYRVRAQILPLLARIGTEVDYIVVVDDACPEESGQLVREKCTDYRVTVLNNAENQGVGGAVLNGYKHALQLGRVSSSSSTAMGNGSSLDQAPCPADHGRTGGLCKG